MDMNIGFMMGSVPVNDRLPIEIKKGVLAQCILPIADDLAANEEDLKSLDIRLKLTGFTGNEVIIVKINKIVVKNHQEIESSLKNKDGRKIYSPEKVR